MHGVSRLPTGVEAMLGQEALVTESVSDGTDGTVSINGELWRARTLGGPLAVGDRVQVEQVDGLKLWVRRPVASLELAQHERRLKQ